MAGQGPDHRLATYGTLSPGGSNFAQLADLKGTWSRGNVRGHRLPSGSGAAEGYPVFHADPSGREVPVHLLDSPDLPAHWHRLDAFEGKGYRRAIIEVETPAGPVLAHIYLAA